MRLAKGCFGSGEEGGAVMDSWWQSNRRTWSPHSVCKQRSTHVPPREVAAGMAAEGTRRLSRPRHSHSSVQPQQLMGRQSETASGSR